MPIHAVLTPRAHDDRMPILVLLLVALLAGASLQQPSSHLRAAASDPIKQICNGPIPGVPGGGTGPTNPQACT